VPVKAARSASKEKLAPKAKREEPAKAQRQVSPFGPIAPPKGATFPIVGIGSSAGGLEALELFLRNTPHQTGMAFVVVQHLDPTHKGMFVELLQRSTQMPVVQATDNATVEQDHVYVIPPNRDISLLHGALHLLPQTQPRGLNLPIDFFFRSLAEDQQERAIGVILSGMGTDGTLGLRAIKEKAGAAFVQEPSSAKFDGMPRSAIDAGLADVVARVEELPARVLAYRQHAPHIRGAEERIEDRAQSALEKVFILLRAHTGNDFSLYKRSTIYRRIERRMGLHQIDNISSYVRYLRENPREIDLLFKELLIGVRSFFRDPVAWDHLRKEVLPALLANRQGALRAWVPGCSTGEEAYSLAIVFREAAEPFKAVKNLTLQIFATDLDHEAIDKARSGMFPDNIAADVSTERLRRFFVQEERGYRVSKEIREMVVFATQNIIMDPPFTKLDVLSCRNLLIYLSGDLQKKLVPLFHYSLNPGGVLFLGSAETVGTFSGLFTPLDNQTRIYRRLDQPPIVIPVEFPASALIRTGDEEDGDADPERVKAPAPNIQMLADRVLVQRSPKSRHRVCRHTLRNPVGFRSRRGSPSSSRSQRAREEVQTTREEMQTSQEELKSTNEELQSANEELQSTNEELTTSKEEMQSLNEELQTVNHELQSKVDELSRSNNDMKNLLNSTDIATLFLDGDLRVRRFTTPTSKIIKLIPADAGRPITDIVSDLDYGDLAEDAREVLRTLMFQEKQVSTRDGRCFTVRIMPYRTLENVIEGVVITFIDASAQKALENALREQTSQVRQMAESLPILVWGARPDGACDYVNPQWSNYTAVADGEPFGWGWLEQVHAEDRERVREEWRMAVKHGNQLDTEFRIRRGDGAYRWFKTRSVRIRDGNGSTIRWYGTCTDIDVLKNAHDARGQA
jgi:PAS domain S-box-containing protein